MNDLLTQQTFGDVATEPEQAFRRGCLQVIALLLGIFVAIVFCVIIG